MSKFPPRVFGWVQENGIPYGISELNLVFGAPQEWISIQEHQAIISDLESRLQIATEALEFYADKETYRVGISGHSIIFDDMPEYPEESYAGLRATEALEKIKGRNENSERNTSR